MWTCSTTGGEGVLSYERWNSYRKLEQENIYTTNASDYLRTKKEKFKSIAKVNRKKK